MPNRFVISLMLAMAASLMACKDYGEFVVAQREWVDTDEFPTLSEMDLTGINLEFSVGSKAHARVLPEVEWPHPVGSLLDRMKRENDGELPVDFDLPLIDGCIYVGLEPWYSRFRRIKFQGRMLLFASSLVASKHDGAFGDGVSEGFQFEPRLAIIDESTGKSRHNIELDSVEFQVVIVDQKLVLITSANESIHTWKVRFDGDNPVLMDPVRLSYPGPRAERMVAAADSEGTFHLAWLVERYGSLTERFVYYARFDSDGVARQPTFMLSDTARDRFLYMTLHDNQALVTWADARFISRGFDTTNQSKMMIGSRSTDGNELWPPMVLHIPKDNSENAFSPIYAVRNDDAIAFLWGINSNDSLEESDMQLGMFDINSRSLKLATRTIPHAEIISTAVKQQTGHQRRMPIAGFEAPKAADCDQWEERLKLKPTGFGIMTPEGLQPITTLDPEERVDDPDQH